MSDLREGMRCVFRSADDYKLRDGSECRLVYEMDRDGHYGWMVEFDDRTHIPANDVELTPLAAPSPIAQTEPT